MPTAVGDRNMRSKNMASRPLRWAFLILAGFPLAALAGMS
jgi:hypothetical protein